MKKISIHAPREGGDVFLFNDVVELLHFNPRPPRGGRRNDILLVNVQDEISIHAPREGGDRPL